MLDKSQIQKITIEFYSHFCDTDLEKFLPGIQFICTPEREKIIKYLFVMRRICPLWRGGFNTPVLPHFRGSEARVMENAQLRWQPITFLQKGFAPSGNVMSIMWHPVN